MILEHLIPEIIYPFAWMGLIFSGFMLGCVGWFLYRYNILGIYDSILSMYEHITMKFIDILMGIEHEVL